MDTIRAKSIITGVLYLLGFAVGILSVARSVDDPEYLTKAVSASGRLQNAGENKKEPDGTAEQQNIQFPM